MLRDYVFAMLNEAHETWLKCRQTAAISDLQILC